MKILKKLDKLNDIPVGGKEELREEDVVSCRECKCLVMKNDVNIVKCNMGNDFYCNKCKPKYGRYYVSYMNPHITYYAEVEVNREGEPIGYKKIVK